MQPLYFVWPGAIIMLNDATVSDSLVVSLAFRTMKPDAVIAWCDIVASNATVPAAVGSFQV